MNIVDTKLFLTTRPMSIARFEGAKTNQFLKPLLNKAHLYIIVKREVPTCTQAHYMERSLYMTFKMEKAHNKINVRYTFLEGWEAGSSDEEPLKSLFSNIKDVTFDELWSFASKGIGTFQVLDDEGNELQYAGDLIPFITYKVLYVGQCVAEPLTKRFEAHHALQKMLIEEYVISKNSRISDELMILPFTCESDTISGLTGYEPIEDWVKAFTNSFDINNHNVTLDCEKALVHGMNPKYNKIKFNDYPESEDGLFKTEAYAYSYSVGENMILLYDQGLIFGSTDDIYASKIVADRDSNIDIYYPGENFTERYAKKIMNL